MGLRTQPSAERINIRLKHNAKSLLERAAHFEDQTVSKFVLTVLWRMRKKQFKISTGPSIMGFIYK